MSDLSSRAVDAVLLGALAGVLFGALTVAIRYGLSRGVRARARRSDQRDLGRSWSSRSSRSSRARSPITSTCATSSSSRAIGACVPGPLADRVRAGRAARRRGAHGRADRLAPAALVRARGDLPGREHQRRARRGRGADRRRLRVALVRAHAGPPASARSARCSPSSAPGSSRCATRSCAGPPRTRRWSRCCAPSSRSAPRRSSSASGRVSRCAAGRPCRALLRSSCSCPRALPRRRPTSA